ncbi:MAG: peptidase M48 [Spirulina sp. DLM2.Bin59]|nr:MAG: peptidase M48 [Spirulina sp. DLM2.Bin59]
MSLKSSLSAVVSVLLLHAGVAQATVPTFEPTPSESKTILVQTKNNPEAFYETAKQELPEDYYRIYRIIDRMARANRLDHLPWRILIAPSYEVNAFATDTNLVAFFIGLLEQIDGDPHAMACVVGHEIAHHTQNHIAVRDAERESILQALLAEAVEKVSAEEEDLRADLESLGLGEQVLSTTGSILGRNRGGVVGTAANILEDVLQGSRQRRIRAATERIESIYAEKAAAIQAQWQALNHQQEFEADEWAYVYMVRSGFNPQGCQTVMTLLTRLGVTASETHPASPDRLRAIQSFASKYPTTTLTDEGRANLAASPNPLTYSLARDRSTLRVNSRAGSANFDDAFPSF